MQLHACLLLLIITTGKEICQDPLSLMSPFIITKLFIGHIYLAETVISLSATFKSQ